MSTPKPSRQALEHLSRLCRNFESNRPATRPARVRPFCSHAGSLSSIKTSRTTCVVRRPLPPSPIRTFTTTKRLPIQPNTTRDPDPQNAATTPVAALPDITNYYTLFPSTLPDGPPGPNTSPPPTQSPENASRASSAPFTIILPTLRKEFLRLQSTHHPDKFPPGSAAHHKSLALSALINTAYTTLSDPLLRAQYLLRLLYDVDVTSEDNAAHPTDQATLMEVMEAQEQIEAARTGDEVERLKDENRARIVDTVAKMAGAFEAGDAGKATEECVRLKYWRSLQGALDDWEEGKEVRLIH